MNTDKGMVNEKDDENFKLLLAIRENQEERVKQLLDKGVDTNYLTNNLIDGRAGALHSAVRLKRINIVKLLLEHNADVDIEDEDGNTPLFSAVYNDVPDEIRNSLIECGADKNHRNKCGTTPLTKMMEDSMYWNFDFSKGTMFELLNACDDLQQKLTNGMSLLHLLSVVHYCEDDKDNSTDHVCVAYINHLLFHGLSQHVLDPLGRTALHYAASACCYQSIKLLIEKGVSVCVKDMKGQTAIHQLGRNSNKEGFSKSLDMLIQHGCDINEQDFFGRTVVHYMVNSDTTNRESLKILHERGAILDIKDKAHLSPLHLAIIPTVSASFKDAEDEYPRKSGVVEVISYLVENGLGVNDTDCSGLTALHLAVRERNTSVVKALVQLGADVNKRTKTGESVVHRATIDSDTFHSLLESCDLSSVDINMQDYFGSTPLHWATWYLEKIVIKTLKGSGADFDKSDNNSKTAADIAFESKRTNLYEEFDIIYDRQCFPLQYKIPEPPLQKLYQELEKHANEKIPTDTSTEKLHSASISALETEDSSSADGDHTDETDVVDENNDGIGTDKAACDDNNDQDQDDNDDIERDDDEEEDENMDSDDECSGCNDLYPECPLLMTIYNDMKMVDLIPWKTHLQEHKAALQSFVNMLLNFSPMNMALFQETPENDNVATAIRDLFSNVSRQINSEYPLFTNTISLAGSWNEGTKTTCPNEFDYNWRLLNFSTPFVIEESSIGAGGFVRFRLKDDMKSSDFSRFVNEDGYLDGRKVIRDFYQIVNGILLQDNTICHNSLYIRKYLKIDKGSIGKLVFRWIGPLYKDMLVEADIVPSIVAENFLPDYIQLDSKLMSSFSGDRELDIVLKTPNERFVRNWNTYFRISVARLEALVIKSLPASIRKGYSLVKALRDTLYMPQVHDDREDYLIESMLTTYILKTCFLHVLEAAIKKSDKTMELHQDDTTKTVTVDWAKRIVKFLTESITKTALPCFFVPGINLLVHESTSVCNDIYICEAEAFCLQELAAVGTECISD